MGRKCLLIIWVGVSADRRMTMREGETNRKMRLAGLSDGNRTHGEAVKEEAGSHRLSEGIARKWRSQKKGGSERHRWPGRERQRKGGKAVTLPPPRPLPLCPLGSVGAAMLWRGEIAKARPRVACMDTVVTSALLTNGSERRALASAPRRLDLMRKMYDMITPQCLYRPLIRGYYLDYRISTSPALRCQTAAPHVNLFLCANVYSVPAGALSERPSGRVCEIFHLSEFSGACPRHCTWQPPRWRTATSSEGLEPRSVRTRCHFRRGNCCEAPSGAD